MPLDWTHSNMDCKAEACTGETDCEGFPTLTDRCVMAQAAFVEYSEADGTGFADFLRDVMLLALRTYQFSLGDLHREVTVAYMLANGIEVPKDLPL